MQYNGTVKLNVLEWRNQSSLMDRMLMEWEKINVCIQETLVDHHTDLDNSRPIPLREEIACIGPLPDEC